MANTYPVGLQKAVATWDTDTFGWLLLSGSGASPNPANGHTTLAQFFTDGAIEMTAPEYTRQTAVTSPTSYDFTPVAQIVLPADSPDFGIMSGGDAATWLILFWDDGADATNLMIQAYPINYTADGVNDCLIALALGDALLVPTSCPTEYSSL